MSLVIVDTGCANIASVNYALKRQGLSAAITADAETIRAAERVILPGVGTAGAAMRNLREKGLVEPLRQLTQPVLGICLGMQMLTRYSEEGAVDCLDVVPARVAAMEADAGHRLPHMGWNSLAMVEEHPLLAGIAPGSYFYFVHSFAVPAGSYTLASCEYGAPFSAVIANGNFMGVQFHPERSGKMGAQLLRNFVEMSL